MSAAAIGAALATTTSPIAAAIPVSSGADFELLELGREFDDLWRRYALLQPELKRRHALLCEQMTWPIPTPSPAREEWDARWDRIDNEVGYGAICDERNPITSRLYPLAKEIAKLPAHTLQGLAVKARALLLSVEVDGDVAGDEVEALIRDVCALAAAPGRSV